MKRIFGCIILVFTVAATPCFGGENPAKGTTIVGTVQSDSIGIGRTVDSYCYLSGTKTVEAHSFYITRIKECKPTSSYYPDKVFYEVAYRGKPYYIEAGALDVSESEVGRLKAMPDTLANSYRKQTLDYSGLNWLNEVKKATHVLKSKKKYGAVILEASIHDMSEYTEGTGFTVTILNAANKPIKYVTVNYVGYNAVNDPVGDYRFNGKTHILRGIGPIEPGANASYTQDYAWMTDIVQSVKVTRLKVQYMDGSSKVIDPKHVIMDEQSMSVLEEYQAELDEEQAAAEDLPPAAPAAK